MRIFKPADTSRRLPTYLQAHTKENFIWQLKMAVLFIVAREVKEKIEERRWRQKYDTTPYYR